LLFFIFTIDLSCKLFFQSSEIDMLFSLLLEKKTKETDCHLVELIFILT